MPRLDAFLELGRQQGCSDIHFTVGRPPLVRQDGELIPVKYRDLTTEETEGILREILDEDQRRRLQEQGSIDVGYSAEGLGRFRINILRQRSGLCAVARVLPETIPTLDTLGLPSVVSRFAGISSGLMLVTGGTGSGKSTTLAAVVNEINAHRNLTVITLEDPVEFVHRSANSLIIQREVGVHVASFEEGLRSALRQDPDVILVGELRDYESFSLALEASETGHLVLGTLHTRGAHQTVHRIIDAFPTEVQDQVRNTLADNLKVVLSQDLVRVADGRGRRAVVEIMVNTPAVAQLIREGKTFKLPQTIATGRRYGMQLMDQALVGLVQSGDIDPDEAFLRASDKKDLARFVTRPELLALLGTDTGAAGNAA